MFMVIILFAFIVIGGSYSVFAIVSGNGDNNTLSWDNITIAGPSGNVSDDNASDMLSSDDSSDSSSNTASSQPSQSSQSSSSYNSYSSSSSRSSSGNSGGSSYSGSSSGSSGGSSSGGSSDSGSSSIVDNGGHYYDVNTGDEISF